MQANKDKHIHAAVDRLIADQGAYRPLELLLVLGRLPYARYEAWRAGELKLLEEALAGNRARILEALATAADWAGALDLSPEAERFGGWGVAAGRDLRLFAEAGADRLARTRYRRADNAPQLDLFFDGGATAALNSLCDALAARDRATAERRLSELARAEPGHRQLAAGEALVDALDHLALPVEDPAAELAGVERLEVLAAELMGASARDFVAPFWRRLAAALPAERFDPAHERLHPSWAAGRYMDWPAVSVAVEAVPGYARHAVLLERLIEAHRLAGDEPAALTALCRFCWRHPQAAEKWLHGATEPALVSAREGFWDLEEPLEADWFPAWLLVVDPGLARRLAPDLGADSVAPGEAYALLHRLCRDPADATARAGLKQLQPVLFAAWLERGRR